MNTTKTRKTEASEELDSETLLKIYMKAASDFTEAQGAKLIAEAKAEEARDEEARAQETKVNARKQLDDSLDDL